MLYLQVYTINDESQYLLIQGLPAIDVHEETIRLLSSCGEIEEHRALKDYPSEEFSETLLVKFKKIQSARYSIHCNIQYIVAYQEGGVSSKLTTQGSRPDRTTL